MCPQAGYRHIAFHSRGCVEPLRSEEEERALRVLVCLNGDDTFQLVLLVDECHVSNVGDFKRGMVGPTYLLDLVEHLY